MASKQDKHYGVFTKTFDGSKQTRTAITPAEAVDLEFNRGWERQTDATAKPEEVEAVVAANKLPPATNTTSSSK